MKELLKKHLDKLEKEVKQCMLESRPAVAEPTPPPSEGERVIPTHPEFIEAQNAIINSSNHPTKYMNSYLLGWKECEDWLREVLRCQPTRPAVTDEEILEFAMAEHYDVRVGWSATVNIAFRNGYVKGCEKMRDKLKN